MSHSLQRGRQLGKTRVVRFLRLHLVGKPGLVHPRGSHGLVQRKPIFQHTQHHREDGVDDRSSARAACHQHGPAIAGHHRGRLRTEHPFARCNHVGGRADPAVPVGDTRMPIEIAHLIVEQKTRPADHDVRTKFIFQRVGVGDRHALLVND